jgi:hypothetical protein
MGLNLVHGDKMQQENRIPFSGHFEDGSICASQIQSIL